MFDITESTWVIGDTHFNHPRLVEKFEPIRNETYRSYGFRCFDNFQVAMWNTKISNTSTVLFLGDFVINKKAGRDSTIQNIEKFTKLLNGDKILLKGNHDTVEDEVYEDLGWCVVKKPAIGNRFPYIIKEFRDKKIMFCHIPLKLEKEMWGLNGRKIKFFQCYQEINRVFQDEGCDLCVHGHVHSYVPLDPRCVNMSVERTDFYPKRISDLLL